MHVDLVRAGGEIVLILSKAVADRDDLLAGFLDPANGCGNPLQFCQPPAFQFIEIKHHHLDAIILRRGFQAGRQVPYQRLPGPVAL